MNKIFLVFLLTCSGALGNPIVVMENGTYYAERKTSEHCVAILGLKSSRVSCEVGYKLKRATNVANSDYLSIILPVFIRADVATVSGVEETLAPSVEFEGKVFRAEEKPLHLSNSRSDLEYYEAPDGVAVLLYRFTVEIGVNRKDVRILVSYDQPTISGTFLYIPIFEDGVGSTEREHYLFDAVAADSSIRIELGAKNTNAIQYSSRISTDLKQKELIVIQVKDADHSLDSIPVTATHGAGQTTRPP
jgi:hypothetical protein